MEFDRRKGTYRLRVVAELAVVFLGVTAAFFVDNYRERLQARERADQLASALLRDVTAFADASAAYAGAIRAGLAEFRDARAAGRRPVPYVLRVPGAEGGPVQVWEAAMQSGAGEVLDPELVFELAGLYHEIEGEAFKYLRYAEFTERQVWPLVAGDTAGFYDASGKLKPEFTAHMRQLEEIAADLASQHERARTVAAKLAGRYPHLVTERTP